MTATLHAFNAGTAAGFRLSCSGSPRGRRREVRRPEVVRGLELEAGVGSGFVDRRGQRPGEWRGSGGERGGGGGRFSMLRFLRAQVPLAGREPACSPRSICLPDRQLKEDREHLWFSLHVLGAFR